MSKVQVTDFPGSTIIGHQFDHIIGILDPVERHRNEALSKVPNRSMFWFEDVLAHGTPPTNQDVLAIMSLIKEKDLTNRDKSVLVHCAAGVSRSTATAISLLIMRGFSIERAWFFISECRPQLWPNETLLRLFDENLGLGGELVKFDKKWKTDQLKNDRMGIFMFRAPVFHEQID